MPPCMELLAKAKSIPKGIRFTDLCALATCYGWHFDRKGGSHHIFKRMGHTQLMNFQDDNGMAKAYQVRQLVRAIEALHGGDDSR